MSDRDVVGGVSETGGLGWDPPVVRRRDPALLAVSPAGATIAERVLDDHELLVVLAGGGTWRSDDVSADLAPGTVLLAPAGSRDAYRWHPRLPTRHAYLHFSVADGLTLPRVARPGSPTGITARLFRYLVWLDARADPAAVPLAAVTFDLLLRTALTGLTPDAARPGDIPVPLWQAVRHVRQRWADGVLRPVSQAELAQAAGISVGAFSRLFRQHLGLPPARAVEGVRLARAAALVRSAGQPLAVVAAGCGFADAYHLSHRFRAVYGVTPSRVRTGHPVAVPPDVRRLQELLLGVDQDGDAPDLLAG
ncbi:AraC family transcriptional regulator [Micromonospora sp. RP3T]|uniref:AraC family transcriptional regulator n=1 Tax=Micromonospora sp. RP3T TaxID=2135446 RepID=UPI0011B1F933|nr:AraC family transcriptional regulator [Micromonospora sp. RP3T]